MKKRTIFFGGVMTLLLAAGGILLSESNTPKYELTPAQIANLDALTLDDESGSTRPVIPCVSAYGDCEFLGVDASGFAKKFIISDARRTD